MPAKKAAPKKKVGPTTTSQLQAAINKQFGPETMLRASDPRFLIERIPTGILSLDDLMDGGFARGRHTEIYGSYNVGKTYASFRVIAMAQAMGLNAGFFDSERSLDPNFAASAGVDIDKLDIPNRSKRMSGNQLIDLMETKLYAGLHDVLVLDSIAALLPRSEQDSQMDAASMGMEQAKMMSKAMRKLTTANDRTVLIYINQTREAVGTMFGPRLRTSGGVAMSFYAGTRLEMSRGESIKRNSKVVNPNTGKLQEQAVVKGHRVLVRVEKDKTGAATRDQKSTFVFDYDLGAVDPIEDLLYLGRVKGFVRLAGDNWWVGGSREKKHGRPAFKRYLAKNTAVAEQLEQRIRATIGTSKEDTSVGAEPNPRRRVSRRAPTARKTEGTRIRRSNRSR